MRSRDSIRHMPLFSILDQAQVNPGSAQIPCCCKGRNLLTSVSWPPSAFTICGKENAMALLELAAGVETHLLRDPSGLNVQNILCPVDFSVFSVRALKYAASMARHFHARLFVQHTVYTPPEVNLADFDEAATRESLKAELLHAGVEGGIWDAKS